MTTYIADNGTEITYDMVARWAQEAENGFPDSIIEPIQDRPWETEGQTLTPRTVRMSDTL